MLNKDFIKLLRTKPNYPVRIIVPHAKIPSIGDVRNIESVTISSGGEVFINVRPELAPDWTMKSKAAYATAKDKKHKVSLPTTDGKPPWVRNPKWEGDNR